MKYCLHYVKGSNHLKDVEEVMIKMHNKHTTAGLLKYLETIEEEQRVIIDLSYLESAEILDDMERWILAAGAHKNLSFRLVAEGTLDDVVPQFIAEELPFFFTERINSMEKLVTFAEYPVTDMYITDELGFDIGTVTKFCHDKNIQVRVYPNVAQSSSIASKSSITKFFIRPEDEFIYEPYVDVYEFFGPLEKQDVLYRIYKSHQWLDSLHFIILGFEGEIYSDRLLPYFGDVRVKCQKRCLQGRCDCCNAMKNMSVALAENADFRIKVNYPWDYDHDIELLKSNILEKAEEEFSIDI